jgi:hypothetical protein
MFEFLGVFSYIFGFSFVPFFQTFKVSGNLEGLLAANRQRIRFQSPNPLRIQFSFHAHPFEISCAGNFFRCAGK